MEVFLEHRLVDPILRVSDLVGLGWDLRICISNKFSGDHDAPGPENHTLRTTD